MLVTRLKNNRVVEIFFSNNFFDKYQHVGYAGLCVPYHWQPIVMETVIKIEQLMWPNWIPFWIKRLIHYLATGNSTFRVKYKWAYNLRTALTGGLIITDIKIKFGQLRIYGNFTEEIYKLIDDAALKCSTICEDCGSTDNVNSTQVNGWITILCEKCKNKLNEQNNT